MFTAPSFALFSDLLCGWVLAPGRHTITAMITVADPGGRRAHDAFRGCPMMSAQQAVTS